MEGDYNPYQGGHYGGDLTTAAAHGIESLYEWGGIVTLLLLVVIALAALAFYLFKRNSTMADKMLDTITQNTIAITTLTEVIRANSK